ncbi:hypothetical protein [Desulfuribacillus alkaliarsenatis]|uniref:Uncharacterized protein n=1 Tax=Desulfuribacillus alkaliarsenatis TaxID=766136 RepID=A0A1E5G210_9FIRM|nr:hypothetical protein [Desulfuribacillus alkaliarsenatis]OEF97015.1 hypothetical protein BHF68_05290 [Desulfuribacillus alkaliarsenatis]
MGSTEQTCETVVNLHPTGRRGRVRQLEPFAGGLYSRLVKITVKKLPCPSVVCELGALGNRA